MRNEGRGGSIGFVNLGAGGSKIFKNPGAGKKSFRGGSSPLPGHFVMEQPSCKGIKYNNFNSYFTHLAQFKAFSLQIIYL